MKSYFIRTDEGLEQVNDVVSMRPVDYGNGPEFQVMFQDSKLDEGMFCYDYVEISWMNDSEPYENLKSFLIRNLDR